MTERVWNLICQARHLRAVFTDPQVVQQPVQIKKAYRPPKERRSTKGEMEEHHRLYRGEKEGVENLETGEKRRQHPDVPGSQSGRGDGSPETDGKIHAGTLSHTKKKSSPRKALRGLGSHYLGKKKNRKNHKRTSSIVTIRQPRRGEYWGYKSEIIFTKGDQLLSTPSRLRSGKEGGLTKEDRKGEGVSTYKKG